MKHKILTTLGMVAALTMSLTAGAEIAEAKKYKLRLATHYPEGHAALTYLDQIKDELAEKSDGELVLKIYPGGQLGDYTLVYEEVMRGSIQMAHIAIPSQYDKTIEMNFLPYLFSNYDEVDKVFAPGSYFNTKYTELHKAQGVKLLGIYAEGFIGVGTKTLPENYANPEVAKKELIRVPPMDVFNLATEDMGYTTTTIPYSDLFSAIQTGVADGWMGGTPELNYLGFRDVIKYYIPYNTFMENTGYFINEDYFEKLPSEYQTLIAETFKEIALDSYKKCKENDEKYLAKLQEYGIEIAPLTDEQLQTIAEHVRAKTWPKLTDKFGKDVIGGIKGDLK